MKNFFYRFVRLMWSDYAKNSPRPKIGKLTRNMNSTGFERIETKNSGLNKVKTKIVRAWPKTPNINMTRFVTVKFELHNQIWTFYDLQLTFRYAIWP